MSKDRFLKGVKGGCLLRLGREAIPNFGFIPNFETIASDPPMAFNTRFS